MKTAIKSSVFASFMIFAGENQSADRTQINVFDDDQTFIVITNNTHTMVPLELDMDISELYKIKKGTRSRTQDLPTLEKNIEGKSDCIIKLSEFGPLTACLNELQKNETYNLNCLTTLNFNKGIGKGQNQKEFLINFWSDCNKSFPLNNKFIIDPYVCNHEIEIVIPDFNIYQTR